MKNNVVNINSNGTILKFNELELIAEGKNYLMIFLKILYLPSITYFVQIYMTNQSIFHKYLKGGDENLYSFTVYTGDLNLQSFKIYW